MADNIQIPENLRTQALNYVRFYQACIKHHASLDQDADFLALDAAITAGISREDIEKLQPIKYIQETSANSPEKFKEFLDFTSVYSGAKELLHAAANDFFNADQHKASLFISGFAERIRDDAKSPKGDPTKIVNDFLSVTLSAVKATPAPTQPTTPAAPTTSPATAPAPAPAPAPTPPTPLVHQSIDVLKKGDQAEINLTGAGITDADIPALVGKFSGNLKILYLGENEISDVSQLTLPDGLTELYLGRNQISDVSQLKLPAGLTELYLQGNQISDVSQLKLPDGLTELYLQRNQISDVSQLTLPAGLTQLYLDGNQISDVSQLTLPDGLTGLYLDGNQISDVSQLTLPDGLTGLDLQGNQISDVSQLKLPDGLTELYLYKNQISDVSQKWLDALPSSLERLDLADNPLTPESLVRVADFANKRGIDLVDITDEQITAARAAVAAPVVPAAPAFTLNKPLEKDDVVKAIYNINHKAWEKGGKQGDEPQLDTYMNRYQKSFNDPSKTLSAEAALLTYATFEAGKTTAREAIPGAADPLTADQGKKLATVLLQIEKDSKGANRPDVTVNAEDGTPYVLEPKELGAYLQTGLKEKDGKTTLQPVDTWRRENNIGLTESAKYQLLNNGGEKLAFETNPGEKRVVSAGGQFIITPPSSGYYGEVSGVTAGDHDALDIYVSPDIHKQIKDGTPYKGDVFVMQQMKDGKPDELKIGYAKDQAEFTAMQSSTWSDSTKFKTIEGKYEKLTHAQYEELKTAVQAQPDLTLEKFMQTQPSPLEKKAPASTPPTAEENANSAADKLKTLGMLDKNHTVGDWDIAELDYMSKTDPEKAGDLYKAVKQFKLDHWTDAKLGAGYVKGLMQPTDLSTTESDPTVNQRNDVKNKANQALNDKLQALSKEIEAVAPNDRSKQFKELKDLTPEQKATVLEGINAHRAGPLAPLTELTPEALIVDKKLNYTDGKITQTVLDRMDEVIKEKGLGKVVAPAPAPAPAVPPITPEDQTKATEALLKAVEDSKGDKVTFEKSFAEIQKTYPNMNLDAHGKNPIGYNHTPLGYAALTGYTDVATSLLDKGANVNAPNARGWTPLQIAAGYGEAEVVQVLLDRPDIDITKTVEYINSDGSKVQATALEIAKSEIAFRSTGNSYQQVVKLLEAKQKELDAKKAQGASAPAPAGGAPALGAPAGTPAAPGAPAPAGGGNGGVGTPAPQPSTPAPQPPAPQPAADSPAGKLSDRLKSIFPHDAYHVSSFGPMNVSSNPIASSIGLPFAVHMFDNKDKANKFIDKLVKIREELGLTKDDISFSAEQAVIGGFIRDKQYKEGDVRIVLPEQDVDREAVLAKIESAKDKINAAYNQVAGASAPATPAPAAPATPAPEEAEKPNYPLYATDQLEGIIARRDMIDLGKGGKGEYANGKPVDDVTAKQIQVGLVASGVAKIVPQTEYERLKQAANGKIVDEKGTGIILFGDAELGNYGKQTDAAIAKLQDVTGFLKKDHVTGRAAAVVLIEALNGAQLVEDTGKPIQAGIDRVKKAVHDELLNAPAGEKPGFDEKERNAIKDRNVDLLTPGATPPGATPAPTGALKP